MNEIISFVWYDISMRIRLADSCIFFSSLVLVIIFSSVSHFLYLVACFFTTNFCLSCSYWFGVCCSVDNGTDHVKGTKNICRCLVSYGYTICTCIMLNASFGKSWSYEKYEPFSYYYHYFLWFMSWLSFSNKFDARQMTPLFEYLRNRNIMRHTNT